MDKKKNRRTNVRDLVNVGFSVLIFIATFLSGSVLSPVLMPVVPFVYGLCQEWYALFYED